MQPCIHDLLGLEHKYLYDYYFLLVIIAFFLLFLFLLIYESLNYHGVETFTINWATSLVDYLMTYILINCKTM